MKKAEKLIKILADKKLTLSGAESCTGGLIAVYLTEVPGASAVFNGSFVAYSNNIKRDILAVSDETLARYGAVSEKTAIEMAQGAANLMKSDIAYSVTGIAGPGGGTPGKPVGTVCFAICGRETASFTELFTGNRQEIREKSAEFIINELILSAGSCNL